MSDTALLLFALVLVVAFAVGGGSVSSVIGWILIGFLLACGAYLARGVLVRGGGSVLGGAEQKKRLE